MLYCLKIGPVPVKNPFKTNIDFLLLVNIFLSSTASSNVATKNVEQPALSRAGAIFFIPKP